MRLYRVANELVDLGFHCFVCVPNVALSIDLLDRPRFPVMAYADAYANDLVFPDGKGPHLIHAWTTCERVRKITQELTSRYKCKYIVHLEDTEESILDSEFSGHPAGQMATLAQGNTSQLTGSHRFLAAAAGCTAFMDRQLEFKPPGLPDLVLWPGFDPELLEPGAPSATFRHTFGIENSTIIFAQEGDLPASNVPKIHSLFLAVGSLRRTGRDIMLVTAGRKYVGPYGTRDAIDPRGVIHLGPLLRRKMSSLLAASDILVQPGMPEGFREHHFPSELPEFLASGKPVVLPGANVLRCLRDGIDALLLESGDALEIAHKVEFLIDNPELAARIGLAGKKFATHRLSWSKNIRILKAFYEFLLKGTRPIYKTTVNRPDALASFPLPVKLIAFYLPQFHPIKENDEFWGKGFTEWTNVTTAKPQYDGHYQPQLPADCGFYDLRLPETMVQQAQLARQYGIYGFCFYYYWFGKRHLLERPLESMLRSGQPNFPFCICWANENWTRNWDGANEELLVQLEYDEGFCERFIEDVIPIMRDRRYIRVAGGPMILVYRVDQLPNAFRVARVWREMCIRAGLGTPHLCAVQSFGINDPRDYGFDAAIEFPPHSTKRAPIDPQSLPGIRSNFEGYIEDYATIVSNQIAVSRPDYPMYRCVMPAWDNTPRRGNKARIVAHSTPALYQRWLSESVRQSLMRPSQEALVFINAWNEWAEGAYLEPDQRLGRARLTATRNALLCGTADYPGFAQKASMNRGSIGSSPSFWPACEI